MEKRRFPRVLTTIQADLRIVPQAAASLPSQPLNAMIRDLSLGGVGLEMSRISAGGLHLYDDGSGAGKNRVYLGWTFPSGQGVKAFGQTVWWSRVPGRGTVYSAGLRFQGVSQKDIEIIAGFLDVSRTRLGETQGLAGSMSVCAWICGRSYGNPGPAGIGVVLTNEKGEVLTQVSEYVGKLTNPAAEYQALIAALTAAKKLRARRVAVYTDSVFIRLGIGGAGVKSPASHLEPLAIMARSLMASFTRVEMISVTSEKNRKAQGLAERAVRLSGTTGRPSP